MKTIGIFYGSSSGVTESVAERIAAKLGVEAADVHDVASASVEEVAKYDVLLLGSSTWGAGDLQDDWYGFLDNLKTADLSGKLVALFGCGDSSSFSDTFCDASVRYTPALLLPDVNSSVRWMRGTIVMTTLLRLSTANSLGLLSMK